MAQAYIILSPLSFTLEVVGDKAYYAASFLHYRTVPFKAELQC